MAYRPFDDFLLVGGTSLALQIGHRHSIDINLFGKKDLDELEITSYLSELGQVQVLKKSKNILIYTVNKIKVDFVNYPYPWIQPIQMHDSFRLASSQDIGAMKLNAIAGRGAKKDFIDVYFLLREFSLTELFQFYKEKYQEGSEFLVLKSLTYFEDANLEAMPLMSEKLDWEEVKEFLRQEVKIYIF
jgi:predicted nucleotidyltransferase component of viral defense system